MLELVNDDYETYYEIITSQPLKQAEDTVKQYVWEYTTGSDRYTDDFLNNVNWEEVVESIDDMYSDNFCGWCGEAKYDNDHSDCQRKEKNMYLSE